MGVRPERCRRGRGRWRGDGPRRMPDDFRMRRREGRGRSDEPARMAMALCGLFSGGGCMIREESEREKREGLSLGWNERVAGLPRRKCLPRYASTCTCSCARATRRAYGSVGASVSCLPSLVCVREGSARERVRPHVRCAAGVPQCLYVTGRCVLVCTCRDLSASLSRKSTRTGEERERDGAAHHARSRSAHLGAYIGSEAHCARASAVVACRCRAGRARPTRGRAPEPRAEARGRRARERSATAETRDATADGRA